VYLGQVFSSYCVEICVFRAGL